MKVITKFPVLFVMRDLRNRLFLGALENARFGVGMRSLATVLREEFKKRENCYGSLEKCAKSAWGSEASCLFHMFFMECVGVDASRKPPHRSAVAI